MGVCVDVVADEDDEGLQRREHPIKSFRLTSLERPRVA
jgi:hypothetical protein